MQSIELVRAQQERLDFLRGLAALMVVANHTRGALYAGGEKILADSPTWFDYAAVALLQLTSFGAEAVILFFVLSGFAMAHSVAFSSSTKRFYLKRIVRIWPPYIAACLVAALIGLAFAIPDDPLLPKLFYLNAAGALTPQFWSLPYEVLFYALCPVILLSRGRVHATFATATLLFVATALFAGVTLNPWPSFFANFAGNALFLFACGAVAYHHIDRVPTVSSRVLLTALGLVTAVAWVSKRMLGEVNIVSMAAIAAFAILAIRNVRPIAWLNFGHFSYSIYLFHYALIAAVVAMMASAGIVALDIRNPFVWIPVAVAITGCCYLLYAVTERVSNRWVDRIRRAPPRPLPTSPPAP